MMNHLSKDTLSDYVLDILSPSQKREVEQHISVCSTCHEALRLERSVVREVRQTIQAVPMPAVADLMALMPDIPAAPSTARPRKRDSISHGLTRAIPSLVACWQPAIAMVTLLILFLGGMMISQPVTSGFLLLPQETDQVSTISQTSPTSTLTTLSVVVVPESQPPSVVVVSNQVVNTLTPIPNATPIAQLIPAPVPNR